MYWRLLPPGALTLIDTSRACGSCALVALLHFESQQTGLGARDCLGCLTLTLVEIIATLIQIIDLVLTALQSIFLSLLLDYAYHFSSLYEFLLRQSVILLELQQRQLAAYSSFASPCIAHCVPISILKFSRSRHLQPGNDTADPFLGLPQSPGR